MALDSNITLAVEKYSKSTKDFPVPIEWLVEAKLYSRKDKAKEALSHAGLDEGIDYLISLCRGKNPSRGRSSESIHLSIDAVKHLCMLSRTALGKEIRTYFIECEKELVRQINKKRLYPDRSEEYKRLYKELKDLLKATGAERHHYIRLAQLLNRVVGKVEGRAGQPITETENYAYCMLMQKALFTGRMFFDEGYKPQTRKAIESQIIKLEPQLKSIQEALVYFN